MARTTIDLDPAVLGELRRRGAREGKSMGQVASELLARAVAEPLDLPAPDFVWKTADLGVPLVDLEDPEAVRRALEQPGVSSTLDANILVYASNTADDVHEHAEALVRRVAAGPELLYLFWPTILGYLRIVTHRAILPRPLEPREAMRNVEALLDRPHVRAPGEGDGFWSLYRSTGGDQARGNDVSDAHLAALMRQHGVRLIYTRDRDFRRFEGIDARDPFA